LRIVIQFHWFLSLLGPLLSVLIFLLNLTVPWGYTSIFLSFTFPANLVFGIDFIYPASSIGGDCAAY
jgi:hypothetical protein